MTDKKDLLKAKITGRLKKLFDTRRKKVIGVVVLMLLVGFFGWRALSGKEEGPQLQTAKVERGMIIASVSASGQVLSVNIMSANTKASGIIQKVYVKDGDQIKKGNKILEIGLDLQGQQKYIQAWSSYLSAKNSLESAKVTLYTLDSQMWEANQKFINDAAARELELTDPTYIQQHDDWLAAEAKYKNQAAVINQAQAALNNSWLSYQLASPVITAPTDGVITSLMFAEGMSIGTLDTGNATSNEKVATVRTEGLPIVSVNLSEIDVSRVETGKKATVTLDSLPDKTFTGEVIGVDRIGQTTSGVTQYPAIIQLDSSSAQILPNMTATANIVIDRKDNVLLVPSGAIQEQDGQTYAGVLAEGKRQFTPVETGLVSDTQTEIVSGLNEGDLVVTGTLSSLGSPRGEASPFGSPGMGGMIRMVH